MYKAMLRCIMYGSLVLVASSQDGYGVAGQSTEIFYEGPEIERKVLERLHALPFEDGILARVARNQSKVPQCPRFNQLLGEGSPSKIDKTEKKLVPTYSNLSTGGPGKGPPLLWAFHLAISGGCISHAPPGGWLGGVGASQPYLMFDPV